MDSGVQQFLNINSIHDGYFSLVYDPIGFSKAGSGFRFYGIGFCWDAGRTGVSSTSCQSDKPISGKGNYGDYTVKGKRKRKAVVGQFEEHLRQKCFQNRHPVILSLSKDGFAQKVIPSEVEESVSAHEA